MPLSKPEPRRHHHTRAISCRGFERDDGLWDIEAHLLDTKSYSFKNEDRGGEIVAGEPIHEMWMRVTIDESLTIRQVEAVTDHAPFNICPAIASAFKQLEGLQIGRGWNRRVKELLGGVRGCTHLVELLAPMASTAYQTLHPRLTESTDHDPAQVKRFLVNSCHAFAEEGEVVARFWPK